MSADAIEALPTRVFLRPIGTPLTIGMSGLAIASFVQSGLDLNWIAKSQGSRLGLVLVAVPFVLQLLACVFSYLARDGAAGTCLGVLSTSWLAIGLLELVSKPGQTSGALGLLMLAAAGTLALAAVAVAKAKPLPAGVFMVTAARFALAGVYHLSSVTFWENVAGIVGLVVCGLAGYCLVAFELESQTRASVLPTLRRGRGKAAISAGPAAQVDGLVHEAGVRQTS